MARASYSLSVVYVPLDSDSDNLLINPSPSGVYGARYTRDTVSEGTQYVYMHNILQSPYALQAFSSLRFRTVYVPSGNQCGHVFVSSTSTGLYSSLIGTNEMLSPADEPASIQRSPRRRV